MFSRAIVVVLSLVVVSVTAAPAEVSRTSRNPDGLIVHEWGTFTSIAGADGSAVGWWPLAQSDLPCFVYRNREIGKFGVSVTVRMETPVLYFYSPRETTVDVAVRFREGVITEWFPQSSVFTPRDALMPGSVSSMKWANVRITPGADPALPTEPGPSHYYAARNTEAAPLRVGAETDKFLFYRGAGRFAVPVAATIGGDGFVHVKSTNTSLPLGAVVLFENHDGRIGYRTARVGTSEVRLPMPQEGAIAGALHSELERLLIAEGLYPKEASAMVETWKDSWFEEGTRLFYILPRQSVDRILPLDITPSPSDVARVFVGRMELVTPAMLAGIRQALTSGDVQTLARHGRFVRPIVDRLVAADGPPGERYRIERLLQSALELNLRGGPTCR